MPRFIGHLVGTSFQTELLIMTLFGLANSTLDWGSLEWRSQLEQIWGLPLASGKIDADAPLLSWTKQVLVWIAVARIFLAHVYSLSYLANFYSILTLARSYLLLPWMLLSFFKNLILELTVVSIGLLLWFEGHLPAILLLEFLIVKTVSLVPAIYNWYSILCFYMQLRAIEKHRVLKKFVLERNFGILQSLWKGDGADEDYYEDDDDDDDDDEDDEESELDEEDEELRGFVRSGQRKLASFTSINEFFYRSPLVVDNKPSKSLTTILTNYSQESEETDDFISGIIDDPELTPAEKAMKLLGLSPNEIAQAQLDAFSKSSGDSTGREETGGDTVQDTEMEVAPRREEEVARPGEGGKFGKEENEFGGEGGGFPKEEGMAEDGRKREVGKGEEDGQEVSRRKVRFPCDRYIKRREIGCPRVSGRGKHDHPHPCMPVRRDPSERGKDDLPSPGNKRASCETCFFCGLHKRMGREYYKYSVLDRSTLFQLPRRLAIPNEDQPIFCKNRNCCCLARVNRTASQIIGNMAANLRKTDLAGSSQCRDQGKEGTFFRESSRTLQGRAKTPEESEAALVGATIGRPMESIDSFEQELKACIYEYFEKRADRGETTLVEPSDVSVGKDTEESQEEPELAKISQVVEKPEVVEKLEVTEEPEVTEKPDVVEEPEVGEEGEMAAAVEEEEEQGTDEDFESQAEANFYNTFLLSYQPIPRDPFSLNNYRGKESYPPKNKPSTTRSKKEADFIDMMKRHFESVVDEYCGNSRTRGNNKLVNAKRQKPPVGGDNSKEDRSRETREARGKMLTPVKNVPSNFDSSSYLRRYLQSIKTRNDSNSSRGPGLGRYPRRAKNDLDPSFPKSPNVSSSRFNCDERLPVLPRETTRSSVKDKARIARFLRQYIVPEKLEPSKTPSEEWSIADGDGGGGGGAEFTGSPSRTFREESAAFGKLGNISGEDAALILELLDKNERHFRETLRKKIQGDPDVVVVERKNLELGVEPRALQGPTPLEKPEEVASEDIVESSGNSPMTRISPLETFRGSSGVESSGQDRDQDGNDKLASSPLGSWDFAQNIKVSVYPEGFVVDNKDLQIRSLNDNLDRIYHRNIVDRETMRKLHSAFYYRPYHEPPDEEYFVPQEAPRTFEDVYRSACSRSPSIQLPIHRVFHYYGLVPIDELTSPSTTTIIAGSSPSGNRFVIYLIVKNITSLSDLELATSEGSTQTYDLEGASSCQIPQSSSSTSGNSIFVQEMSLISPRETVESHREGEGGDRGETAMSRIDEEAALSDQQLELFPLALIIAFWHFLIFFYVNVFLSYFLRISRSSKSTSVDDAGSRSIDASTSLQGVTFAADATRGNLEDSPREEAAPTSEEITSEVLEDVLQGVWEQRGASNESSSAVSASEANMDSFDSKYTLESKDAVVLSSRSSLMDEFPPVSSSSTSSDSSRKSSGESEGNNDGEKPQRTNE